MGLVTFWISVGPKSKRAQEFNSVSVRDCLRCREVQVPVGGWACAFIYTGWVKTCTMLKRTPLKDSTKQYHYSLFFKRQMDGYMTSNWWEEFAVFCTGTKKERFFSFSRMPAVLFVSLYNTLLILLQEITAPSCA